MQAYDIGISALTAQQAVLSTTGQNIANSSTPGYHRLRVDLATRRSYGPTNSQIGSGVDVAQIRRLRDSSLEQSLLALGSQLARAETNSLVYSQIQQVLTPGTGAIQDRLTDFFNRLEDVANSPANSTARSAFIASSNNLAQAINHVEQQWRDLRESLTQNVRYGVEQVNSLTSQLADIQRQISAASGRGEVPNSLLDHRDKVLAELATWVDVSVAPGENSAGRVNIGNLGSVSANSIEFRLEGNAASGLTIVSGPNGQPVEFTGGKLSALLDQVNQQIPAFRQQFQEFAETLTGEINRLHSVGLPLSGGLNQLASAYPVGDPSSPLSSLAATASVQAGDLYVTVTDLATNARTTHRISIDPQADSLQDINSRIDSIPGVAAFTDALGRQIISAEAGYSFDFAGRVDVSPQIVSWSGTAAATVGGTYSGSGNAEWTWQIVGSGQVGVTPGLELEVRDQNGQLVSRQNIGAGYQAGQPLTIVDGLTISLTSGSVTGGDSLRSTVIADSDTANYLSAVGLNSLFVGNLTSGVSVRSDLRANSALLSISSNAAAGDAGVAERMLSLRTSRISAGGTLTPVEHLAGLTAEAGIAASNSETEVTFLQDQSDGVRAQQQAVSGVNLDEELVTMMEAQRGYQAAARYLTILSAALDELLGLVR